MPEILNRSEELTVRHPLRLSAAADLKDTAMAFEAVTYPHATPETRRLLYHARGAIRAFLESDLGQ